MKKAVVYCRVSTDKEDQKNSLDNQRKFFSEYISRNPEWEFVDIYVDEGLSGTSTKKRKAFNQMIADGEAGLYDLILTKEISRFARNTLDSIYYTRLLKSKNIGVYFINDNINTLDPDSELRLTIMASIAQEESRKTSDRVKWGQRRSMEKGVVFGAKVYGYSLVGGQLSVNEEEARVVKLIFFKYLTEGKGVNIIARELDERGITTPTKIKHWTQATVLRILKNEKYAGVLKQKKQITTDYLNHYRKRNEGEEDFVIIQDHHPAIIQKDTFQRVQEELKRRLNHKFDKTKYSNRYYFSGKIICGQCGTRFKRRCYNRKAKNPQTVWECGASVRYGKKKINQAGLEVGCDNKFVKEEALKLGLLNALDICLPDKQKIINNIVKILTKVLSANTNEDLQTQNLKDSIQRIESKKKKLVELYMDKMITKEEFQETNNELLRLSQLYTTDLEKAANLHNQQQNPDELLRIIRSEIENIVNCRVFSDEVCKSVLEKIIIHSRDNMEFFLKGNS